MKKDFDLRRMLPTIVLDSREVPEALLPSPSGVYEAEAVPSKVNLSTIPFKDPAILMCIRI